MICAMCLLSLLRRTTLIRWLPNPRCGPQLDDLVGCTPRADLGHRSANISSWVYSVAYVACAPRSTHRVYGANSNLRCILRARVAIRGRAQVEVMAEESCAYNHIITFQEFQFMINHYIQLHQVRAASVGPLRSLLIRTSAASPVGLRSVSRARDSVGAHHMDA